MLKFSEIEIKSVKDILSSEDRWCKRDMFKDFDDSPLSLQLKAGECSQCCLLGAAWVKHFFGRDLNNFSATRYEKTSGAIASAIKQYAQTNTRFKQYTLHKERSTYLVTEFNDDPRTTFEDIQKVLEIADV